MYLDLQRYVIRNLFLAVKLYNLCNKGFTEHDHCIAVLECPIIQAVESFGITRTILSFFNKAVKIDERH